MVKRVEEAKKNLIKAILNRSRFEERGSRVVCGTEEDTAFDVMKLTEFFFLNSDVCVPWTMVPDLVDRCVQHRVSCVGDHKM